MINRIDRKFRELKKQKKKAFIAYITAGDPDLATTPRIVRALERSGVDIVELGIPFSDPLADGPIIQAASGRALRKKVNLGKIFRVAGSLRRGVRDKTEIPLVFMTYYNPVLKYGLKSFFSSCLKNGVDGVIVPDLPYEEAKEFASLGRRYKVAIIFLVAPTSTPARIRNITRISRGFIYYVSLTGVTGLRRKLPPEISSKVRFIKSVTDKPVAVGFGVSNPKQAAEVVRIADGVIVGSAIVKIIGDGKNIIARISRFAGNLAKAIHNV